MEVLNTIGEIFAHNLTELRKARRKRQEDVALLAGIEVRDYQRYEGGQIPSKKPEIQKALAKALGVPLGRLFLDPDLSDQPSQAQIVTPEKALEVLAEALKGATLSVPRPRAERIAIALSTLEDRQLDGVISYLSNAFEKFKAAFTDAPVKPR